MTLNSSLSRRLILGFASVLCTVVFVAATFSDETGRLSDADLSATIPGHPASSWVDSVFATLSLEQKIGQLFVIPASGRLYNEHDRRYRALIDLVEHFEVGGVIFFSGEPLAQVLLTNELQERANVPLLISQDMEWGVAMRLDQTTAFPHAMALGAAGNPELAYSMGRVIAAEASALGVHVNYAPVADVNNNPNNPVINVRSFGEDPDQVGALASAYVSGLQDGGIIATAKHFPGHGDTDVDSHSGIPVLTISQSRLDSLELVPFMKTIEAGVGAIMIAHIALPEIDDSDMLPATLSGSIVTDLLREKLRYDGLIVTDALRMRGVADTYGSGEAAIRSLNAGVDMVLLPYDFYAARRAVIQAVETGKIPVGRIDESVRRVLGAKEKAGLALYEPADLARIRRSVSDPAAEALAGEIARKSITLLNNQNNLLPIRDTRVSILDVTISDSDDSSQGRSFNRILQRIAPDARVTRVLLDWRSHESEFDRTLEAAQAFDLIIVQSYMLVRTGSGRIGLDERQRDFLDKLVGGNVPVVLVAFGNPYVTLSVTQPDAFVAAFSSSSASKLAAAQALFGQIGFQGRLPVTIPGLYAIGDGIRTEKTALRFGRPEDVGMDTAMLDRIDTLLWNAIEDTAFPGAAFAVGRPGIVARTGGFGYFTYDSFPKCASGFGER